MTRVKRLSRWLVVACSMLLVAGFICYQAGATSWVRGKREAVSPVLNEPGERIIGSTKTLSIGTFEWTVDLIAADEQQGKWEELDLQSSGWYSGVELHQPTAPTAESQPAKKKSEK